MKHTLNHINKGHRVVSEGPFSKPPPIGQLRSHAPFQFLVRVKKKVVAWVEGVKWKINCYLGCIGSRGHIRGKRCLLGRCSHHEKTIKPVQSWNCSRNMKTYNLCKGKIWKDKNFHCQYFPSSDNELKMWAVTRIPPSACSTPTPGSEEKASPSRVWMAKWALYWKFSVIIVDLDARHVTQQDGSLEKETAQRPAISSRASTTTTPPSGATSTPCCSSSAWSRKRPAAGSVSASWMEKLVKCKKNLHPLHHQHLPLEHLLLLW